MKKAIEHLIMATDFSVALCSTQDSSLESISLEIYEINPSCLVDQYLAGCLPVDCAVTTVVSTY